MAVIKDVAKMAGVSTATVSKVINRPQTVKESTRIKVLEVMASLNYSPSPMAQSMRTKKTYRIAVISPDISNPFFAELYSKLRLEIVNKGYTPILYSVEDRWHTMKDCFGNASIRQMDGIILCFVDDFFDIDKFIGNMESEIPIAVISWNMNHAKHHSIVVDVFEGMYKGTQHVASLGHKHIAYIGGPDESRISKEKHAGFVKALKDNQLVYEEAYFASGAYSLQTGYLSARQFMMLRTPPTAMICANDILAIGCMKYLLSMKVRIPEDVAVTGFDDISLASMYEPSITTVSIPMGELAKLSFDMLMKRMNKSMTKPSSMILKTSLVIRNSTNSEATIEL